MIDIEKETLDLERRIKNPRGDMHLLRDLRIAESDFCLMIIHEKRRMMTMANFPVCNINKLQMYMNSRFFFFSDALKYAFRG